MEIKLDNLTGNEIQALLTEHLEEMRATSPPESVHALDLTGLRHPDIQFFSLWDNGSLVGCGALKSLSAVHGEIKSMRTAKQHRNRGIASTLLHHLLAQATTLGLERVSLETGSMDYFTAARALYRKFGFVECAPFADYRLDPNSVFMTKTL